MTNKMYSRDYNLSLLLYKQDPFRCRPDLDELDEERVRPSGDVARRYYGNICYTSRPLERTAVIVDKPRAKDWLPKHNKQSHTFETALGIDDTAARNCAVPNEE